MCICNTAVNMITSRIITFMNTQDAVKRWIAWNGAMESYISRRAFYRIQLC